MNNKTKINKWVRILHRDLGYFTFGIIIIYAVSGIALNHRKSWNPSIKTISSEAIVHDFVSKKDVDDEFVAKLLTSKGVENEFIRYFFRKDNLVVLYDGGKLTLNTKKGEGRLDVQRKRHAFNQMVFLHMTNKPVWIWFSDIFAVMLLITVITGLIMIKGKNGFKKRGIILGVLGLFVPVIILIFIR